MKCPWPAVVPAMPMLLAACATTTDGSNAPSPLALAAIQTADGAAAGTARLVANAAGLSMIIDARGMAPGSHGVHLHAIGKCEAPAFTTAGGHLNPGQRQHGHDNPMGAHLGDLPNLVIGPDGTGSLTIPLPGTTTDLEASLLDADGTAIVVHAAADDYRTDPSGNSGARIACGVLTRPG